MVNNHVQNNLHNMLQDEDSSQLRQLGERGPRTEAAVHTNCTNDQNNNETGVVRLNDTRNTNGRKNGNYGNNENGGRV
jgi:type 1 fimbria pilin